MKPIMRKKMETAAFVPYVRRKEGLLFFLQKRTKDAPRRPGFFAFFGGGLEKDESPEQGMKREVMEELVYTPMNSVYFSRYEAMERIHHVFVEEVGEEFPIKIKVREGEYGKFFNVKELAKLKKVSPLVRFVTSQLSEFFTA